MDSCVYVDIETNGGSVKNGRVIEVAAIKVADDKIIETYQSLINPSTPIPYWITNLTGITNEDIVHAPYFEDIAEDLQRFMEGYVFVAHNAIFDYSFLKAEFKRVDKVFSPKIFCTVKMSRALYPENKGHSLQKIIERHKLSPKKRHRAFDDAMMMYEYVNIAKSQKGTGAFNDNVKLQLKTKTLPPNVDEATVLNLPEKPGVYIFEDDAGLPLYVGKSVNIRTRVRSHFANATTIAKEMKMSLQSHNISYVTTETEIEALLLESAMVKKLQPVHNRLLRRKKTQHILAKDVNDDGFLTFSIQSHDLSTYAHIENIYGVFKTKNHAKTKLEETTRAYQLCPKLMGLEKGRGACFRRQLGLCRGACESKESIESYNARVEYTLERLKIETWPYKGKISVRISSTRSMIIDQWVPEGIYDHTDESFSPLQNSFDIDTYSIVRSFIRSKQPIIAYAE